MTGDATSPTLNRGTLVRDEYLAVAVGLLYLVGVFWREPLLNGILRIPPVLTPEYLQIRGSFHVLALIAVRLPALLLLLWIVLGKHGRELRRSVGSATIGRLGRAVLLTALTSFLLNGLNLWPFTWRWAEDTTAAYIGAFLDGGQWVGLCLWAVLVVAIVPLIEEVVFRFGLLRILKRYTHSSWVSILGSSVLFALVHLGYVPIWKPDTQHALNACWLFLSSILLGWITLRSEGHISIPIAIHAARNGIELLLLVVALSGTSG